MSASSVYDSFRLAESESGPDRPDFCMAEKNVIDINDTNGQNYAGGQITFDLNQLVSSESFLDWASSYITIPVQFSITGDGTQNPAGDVANLFSMCFKGSNYSLINSVNLTCSNVQLVGNTQMSNIPIAYKLLTSFDSTDVDVRGASIGFQKDASRTFTYQNATGEANNYVGTGGFGTGTPAAIVAGSVTLANASGSQNVGMFRRCVKQSVSAADPNVTNFVTAAGGLTSSRVNMSYTTPASDPLATANAVVMQLWVQIKMEFLHDIFKKMPLCRGVLWQLVISTHLPTTYTSTVTIPNTPNWTAQPTPASTAAVQSLNQFCPFMVSTVGNGAGLNGTLGTNNATGTFTYNAKIGWGTNTTTTMHCVTYKMSPAAATRYMSNPRKTVMFEDFIRSSPSSFVTGIAAGGQANVNISPGQTKVRGLLIAPYLSGNTTGNGNTGYMSALQSPLTSCGATVSPYAFIDQFNVMLGGRPIFPKNIAYRYDNFLREQFGINAPNGNGIWSNTSGLFDVDDFNAGYGYIYVNLERHLAATDDISVAVDLMFTNSSARTMSYNVFLFFEKEMEIDISNGKVRV